MKKYKMPGLMHDEQETRVLPVVPSDTLYFMTVDSQIIIRIDTKHSVHINPNVNRDVLAKAILAMYEDLK
jgi:hypothetical protein